MQDKGQAVLNVCLRTDLSLEEDGLTERWAGAGHLLLKPGEHVGHESPPSQGSLLGPSLLVQRESVAASGQAQPPHQVPSNLEGRVRPLRGLVRAAGGADPTGGVFQVSVLPHTPLIRMMTPRLGANLGPAPQESCA